MTEPTTVLTGSTYHAQVLAVESAQPASPVRSAKIMTPKESSGAVLFFNVSEINGQTLQLGMYSWWDFTTPARQGFRWSDATVLLAVTTPNLYTVTIWDGTSVPAISDAHHNIPPCLDWYVQMTVAGGTDVFSATVDVHFIST